MMLDFKNILQNGTVLKSSGTTGPQKEIFQPPMKLRYANIVARDSQHITKSSRIYTVCKLHHAGGLLAQTLPAYEIGADVVIEDFSAYRFIKEIGNYTHTHLTPDHVKALMLTKGFWELDLNGIWVTCGSDRVSVDMIRSFVSRGATFMSNWGMSEIGPIAINKTFRSEEDIWDASEDYQSDRSIMGDTCYCETKILEGELYVRGDICVYPDWFNTKDRVSYKDGSYWYLGRS